MSRTDTEPGASSRLAYLDNLKTWLIAGIIVGHGLNSYTDFGSWPYQDVQEVMVSEVTETVFAIVASLFTLFLMGLFFLISGLFTAGSFERKGARRGARRRRARPRALVRPRVPARHPHPTRAHPVAGPRALPRGRRTAGCRMLATRPQGGSDHDRDRHDGRLRHASRDERAGAPHDRRV